MTDIEDRLHRIERAAFAAKDDWPTGHASLQQQLDELYHLYVELKLAVVQAETAAEPRNSLFQRQFSQRSAKAFLFSVD